MNHQSDFGYSVPSVGGEVRWSSDYWAAYECGDYRAALNIALEHQASFDWEGEQPEHWTEDARYEAAQLGIISAEGYF